MVLAHEAGTEAGPAILEVEVAEVDVVTLVEAKHSLPYSGLFSSPVLQQ